MVSSYLSRSGSQVVWGPIFRRNLLEVEAQFTSMLSLLDKVFVLEVGLDQRVLKGSAKGSFTMAFSFSKFVGISHVSFLLQMHLED